MNRSTTASRTALVAAACLLAATCKKPTTPEDEPEQAPPETRPTAAQDVPGSPAGPLGGSLFEFDHASMKPWECEACPEPRFRETRKDDDPEPDGSDGSIGLASLLGGGTQHDLSRSESPYFVVESEDPSKDRLPLKSTRADVAIAGSVAEVRVTQVYENEGESTIEAIYTFPASTRAAVHAMRMTIGERTIEAVIKERAEARKDYEEARADGKTASLLEQERPNVFTMNVANILPGDIVKVEMIYNEMLVPENGQYEFVYPTVVGPRYLESTEDPLRGEQWSTREYGEEGEKPAYTFGLDAYIDSPVAISCLSSPTHEVEVLGGEGNEALVSLPESTDTGDRDFVLRYSLAPERIRSGALLYEAGNESFFMLMASPPTVVPEKQIVPREYVFVVDVSGSMAGFPLDVSKALMKDLLSGLRKTDYFNLVFFASNPGVLAPKSIPATAANVDDAFREMDAQQGGGGTELRQALETAIDLPAAGDAHRVVVVVTDGFISADRECIGTIRQSIDRVSVFTFGIGLGVNRYLVEGLARAGRGAPFVVTGVNEAKSTSRRFRAYIDSPVMRDIEVSFDGFDAYDIQPSRIPTLFAGRPIVVLGKYRGEPEGVIVVKGTTPQGPYEQVLDLARIASRDQNEALRYLWAREAIRNLDDLTGNISPESEQGKKTLALGLKYSLLTQFTSFVAVDSQVRADGDPEKVDQPLPLPAGVPQTAVSSGGIGTLGAFGHGGGGGHSASYGRGAVREGGGTVARIMPGSVSVSGSLDEEVIRRVVRRHINEIRFCYTQALASDPDLSGTIVVEFVIDPAGEVISASVASTTLDDADVPKCIVEAFERWTFPAPEDGGKVEAIHRFTLSTS
jgi:Ca-activated chloride channel family protein